MGFAIARQSFHDYICIKKPVCCGNELLIFHPNIIKVDAMKLYRDTQFFFENNLTLFWGNLSRLNNLLAIMNISLFFITGLVSHGYYYTFFSLILIGITGTGLIFPCTLVRHLWYYAFFVMTEFFALFFLASSIVYLVRTAAIQ